MKTANCPSCGAPVTFKSGASLVAVCEYCTATLIKRGTELENIGKMAELQDDPTLIQIGTEGSYKGMHFGVIGRIQLEYGEGLWNEWYLMFDDMRTGWLGEAQGEFYITFEKPYPTTIPSFDSLVAGEKLDAGQVWDITNIEYAKCIGGQGELPFTVGPGYEAPVVDLQSGATFATLDYSDEPARFYVGERTNAKDIKLTHLREPDDPADMLTGRKGPTSKADAFNCPQCAAPLSVSGGKIQTIGCASCGAVLDTSKPQVAIIQKAQEAAAKPLIPLGSKGRIDNAEWAVIGYLRKQSTDGFTWGEYLLFHPSQGYLWLIESDGHWTLAKNTKSTPKQAGVNYLYDKVSHEAFATYDSSVTFVVGEFNWKVRAGDTAAVADFIAPPGILSREKTKKEVSWTLGEYRTPAQITETFALKQPLPPATGVAPHQVNPHIENSKKMWRWFMVFSLLTLCIQMFYTFRSNTVAKQDLVIKQGPAVTSVLSAPFTIKESKGGVRIEVDTDVQNTAAGLTYTLVDKKSGQAFRASKELEFYSGFDEGEEWKEGERSGAVVLQGVPPGEYQLNIEGELAGSAKSNVGAKVRVQTGHASWLNWVLLQLVLLILPIMGSWRKSAFETERWAQSDKADDDE